MDFLKTVLPWIGAAATGNVPMLVTMAAGELSSALGVNVKPTADAIAKAFAGATPEQLQAAKLADQDFALKMQAMGYDSIDKFNAHVAEGAQSVNTTMQAEAAADHWPTYSWRPFIGFVFGLYVTSLFVLPLFGKTPVVMSPDMVLTIGGILGIASFFRGKMQADPSAKTDNRG